MRKVLLSVITLLLFSGCLHIKHRTPQQTLTNRSYTSDKDVFMIVLDTSGSMIENDKNSRKKIDVAKEAIRNLASKLDNSKVNAGLVSFPGRGIWCDSTELNVAPNNNNFSLLVQNSQNIKPDGKTPLARAINFTNAITKNIDKNINIIILSDGMETCGGDPALAIRGFANRANVKLNTFVIGYGVDENTRNQLKSLVVGSGAYYDAGNTWQLINSIDKITTKLDINKIGWKNGVYDFRINFDTDKAIIKPKYRKNIQEFANYLKQNSYKVQIQGHTDSLANDSYNQKLSKRRANSVKKALIKQGISKDRISTIGYGESKPISTNATKAGRFENRRVEAHIIKK